MKFIVAIALFFISENSYAQTLSSEEKKLYDILMQYYPQYRYLLH
jgi:hypothetical protein